MRSFRGLLPQTLSLALAGFSFLLLFQSGLAGIWQTGVFVTLRPGLETVGWIKKQEQAVVFFWRFTQHGAQQLAQLEKERSSLRIQESSVSSLEKENADLRSALGKKTWENWSVFRLYGARDTWFVDGGCADGLAVGQVVLADGGNVLGQVETVAPHYAAVRTFFDQSWRIPVRVGSESAQGLLETSRGIPEVHEIAPQEKIEKGDTVVSSGLAAFPPGLPIGRVTQVKVEAGMGDQNVEVEPYTWPEATDFVRVPVLPQQERRCQ